MSKEHAYAYEAGYRDGSINYELEHCPACKNVADLQEALAENAKLRERVAELEELLPDSGRWYRAETVEAYVAEIAKLRELVQRMRRYMVDAVEHCGYDAQTTGYTMLGSRLEECEDAMRELGVEVES